MIVPTQPGGTPAEMPSEANLLMALAEMHKQGRFKVAGDVVNMPPNKPWQQLQNALNPGAKGYEGADPNEVAKGVMSGKVKVLNPAGK